MVAKFFNTAGPIKPKIHYNVDPLHRMDLDEIQLLIDQQKYFVLHAPRQTGKTSCMLALRDYLNQQGVYIAVYVNIEGGQAARNDVRSAIGGTIDHIAEELRAVVGNQLPQEVRDSVREIDPTSQLTTFLRRLSERLPQPLILILDEIDALVGDSLVSVLRQIRVGYDSRPERFPQTVILCGVRDVRDYRIVLSSQDIVTGGSAFNIKAESLRLGNFSKKFMRFINNIQSPRVRCLMRLASL